MEIRFVSKHDIPSLLEIYAQYIDTPITFEYLLPSKKEFTSRVMSIAGEYPYLVCEENDRIIGYAYAHRQMERQAYQWNAELSVYLDKSYTSKGLGRKLYTIAMEMLKLQGIRNVYGIVTMPNEKSEKLHLSLGFKPAGTYHNTGYKCGKWRDVTWFEKQITLCDNAPEPFITIDKIPMNDLMQILKNMAAQD